MERGRDLSLVRWYSLDHRCELRVPLAIDRTMTYRPTAGIFPEEIIAIPVHRRPDWPRCKTAAAIRAHVTEHVVDAARAERAFERADARVARIGRQRCVAVLAAGSQLEHQPGTPSNVGIPLGT